VYIPVSFKKKIKGIVSQMVREIVPFFVPEKEIKTMARIIQVPYQYSVDVPIGVAQAAQKKIAGQENTNPISLNALGLLINLLSYPVDWEIHKTELYKRFASDGEKSVRSAWNNLVEANYIIEFKYRVGKKYEYVYYLRKFPFSDEEKAEILANAEKEFGEIWGLRFGESKLETPKGRGNQKNLLNKKPILNTNNKDIDNIDDDKRTSPSGESSAVHNEESINLIISNFRELTKDELSDRSFNAIVRKVVDKYNQGKINSFRDYLATALANKIEELELRRAKDKAREELKASKQLRIQKREKELKQLPLREKVPFYNWLEE
jgi:hypothetical protein